MATIPGREAECIDAINSIIDQVDHLFVYQNGYKNFNLLKKAKITYYSSLDTGSDMGDAGKFYRACNQPEDTFYFSLDDDLIYPPDYVNYSLSWLKKFPAVAHHGRSLRQGATDYWNDTILACRILGEVAQPTRVQFAGTGTLCIDTSKVKLCYEDFKTPNMADVWAGKRLQEQGIQAIVPPHAEGWAVLNPLQKADETIWYTNTYDNEKRRLQNEILVGRQPPLRSDHSDPFGRIMAE